MTPVRMKILYHHRTMADGAEGIHIREMVLALRCLGHEVLVVALAGIPRDPSPRHGVATVRFRRLIPALWLRARGDRLQRGGYRRRHGAVRELQT